MSEIELTLLPEEPAVEAAPEPAPEEAVVEVAPVDLVPEGEPPLPKDHVKVELLHDVSLWIHGVAKAWTAGWQVVHKDVVALIKQTHLKSALRE